MKKLFLGLGLMSINFLVFGQETNYNLPIEKTININEEDQRGNTEKIEGTLYFKGVPFTGKTISKYPDGQIKTNWTYINGKREGLGEGYYENGQLKEKGTYKDNRPEGLSEVYYENGQVKTKINFKDGKRVGVPIK